MRDKERNAGQEAAVSKAEYEALAEFRYAIRLYLRFSEQAAHAVGLTPQQHQALLAIQGFPEGQPVTISILAERLQIQHHSAVGLVDRLEAEGMVERQASSGDRRRVHVIVTEKGAWMLERLTTTHREELHRVGPDLHLLLRRLLPSSTSVSHGEPQAEARNAE